MNPTEAANARESAWSRYNAAREDHNAWARIIARDVVRGDRHAAAGGDLLLIARAAEFEAYADWQEARDRWQAVRAAA